MLWSCGALIACLADVPPEWLCAVTAGTSPVRAIEGVDHPNPGTYTIDPSHTDVGFVVRHLMLSKTRGRFPEVTGRVVVAEDPLESSVEVSIMSASVETGDERRDGHLRSQIGRAHV